MESVKNQIFLVLWLRLDWPESECSGSSELTLTFEYLNFQVRIFETWTLVFLSCQAQTVVLQTQISPQISDKYPFNNKSIRIPLRSLILTMTTLNTRSVGGFFTLSQNRDNQNTPWWNNRIYLVHDLRFDFTMRLQNLKQTNCLS